MFLAAVLACLGLGFFIAIASQTWPEN